MTLDDHERSSLASFPLAWRWTGVARSGLLPDELSLLMPLTSSAASRAHSEAIRLSGRDGLYRQTVADFRFVETRELRSSDVSEWLLALPLPLDERVVASWDASTALALPWGLFARRWDDFCYPSSDDVTVLPLEGAWVLAYFHFERLEWAVRRAE